MELQKDFQYWRNLIRNTRAIALKNIGHNKFEDFDEDEQIVLAAYILIGAGSIEKAFAEYVFKEFIEEISGVTFKDADDLIAYMLTHGSEKFRNKLIKLARMAATAEVVDELQKISEEE